MSKLDIRRKNLKKAHEWEERIKEMGHPSEERGIKAVREVQKEDDIKQEKLKTDALEKISHKRKFSDNEYRSSLCGWGKVVLLGINLPKGYDIRLTQNFRNSKKIEVWIKSPSGWYARGIDPSFIPEFDMRAVEDKVMEAIDFIDALDPKHKTVNNHGNRLT